MTSPFHFIRRPFASSRRSTSAKIIAFSSTSILTFFTVLTLFFLTLTSTFSDVAIPTPTPPNPGDDWLLAPRLNWPAAQTSVDADARSTDAVPETFSTFPWTDVEAVERIVKVDATEIETEDRRIASSRIFQRRPGGAFLLSPPVDPNVAAQFCFEIQNRRGTCDRIWLRNGDEFGGTLLSVDRRRVVFRAFDVDVSIPRGRVRAVRFADKTAPSALADEAKNK